MDDVEIPAPDPPGAGGTLEHEERWIVVWRHGTVWSSIAVYDRLQGALDFAMRVANSPEYKADEAKVIHVLQSRRCALFVRPKVPVIVTPIA
jgi:hypothetical protein